MKIMTHTTFDTTAHPRNASSGRFTEAEHTAPETALEQGSLAPSSVLADIDAVTHGREALDSAIGAGRFGYAELDEARSLVWEGAGGLPINGSRLGSHRSFAVQDLTVDGVYRALEVTHYRAASGRYCMNQIGGLKLAPVDETELRNADWQAERRSEHVAEMWGSGQQVGAEAEISDDAARLFAEDALQNLPARLPITLFPRLAEFANAPYTEAGGADPAKIDALHDELARIRSGHDYLAPHKQRRLDMLATFALHALPGQD